MVDKKNSRLKRIGAFLRSKYRLVILNDNTFGEKISLRVSPLGLITGIFAITIVMTTLVITLVAFTPLREYIPGYGTIAERKQILSLSLKADSMEQALESRSAYMNSILNVLNEKFETKTAKPKKDTTGKYAKVNTKASANDLEFRTDLEQNKTNSIATKTKYKGLSELIFFTPVLGLITSSFNLSENHYGIDIVTKPDETIKSTLDGTVLFTGFSAEDGNVIQVQHSNNLTSIYKHNSTVFKKTGDRVKAGEAISVVGNTGEKSKGPHLHFELWFDGQPINPQDFVAF
ncbi:MAG: M23 family metallopeptidase [Bacteroidota bacterium]|nr:M23 family metallopeptidase [Bacteroidota bacterium]MDP3147468.1 M23 family metallopeptidase [Bacteroidota bacterium]MDP3557960.1 M23 family metallopeptidase [Bacteroidota bacterium]